MCRAAPLELLGILPTRCDRSITLTEQLRKYEGNPARGTPLAIGKRVGPLSVAAVSRIATEAALALSPRLHIVGVTVGAGNGNYAEVIIDIAECRQEPCRLTLGVLRNTSESALRHEIADRLQRDVLPLHA